MFIDDPEKPRNIKVAKALKNPEWDIMPPYMAFSDAKEASLKRNNKAEKTKKY